MKTTRQQTPAVATKAVYSEAPAKKEFTSYHESIRIVESKNHFKKIVAREISNYLAAVSRPWDTLYKADVNSETLAKHLNSRFPEFKDGWEFRTTQSQGVFDIVCLGAGLIIEVKSTKSGNKRITSNASVYPDTVKAKHVLAKNFKLPKDKTVLGSLKEQIEDTTLDALVVCVTYKDGVVDGYAIVDGHYWNVDEEMFLACREVFPLLREKNDEIMALLAESNTFVDALASGSFGYAVNLNLRKLIDITNPVGRLGVLGKWQLGI